MRKIILRELLDYLQSIQFIVLLGVCVVLFILNGFISVKAFNEQNDLYNKNFSQSQERKSTIMTNLNRQPTPLLFLSEGGGKFRPSGYTLKPKGVIDADPAGPRNFKLPVIPDLDWSFIIKIIFSLYVILLGYGTIAGEKEQGTLSLILSNSISRIKVLVAKYCAILLTVLIPLLIGGVLSLLIMGISIPQVLSKNSLVRIFVMLGLAVVYLSIFAFLSLLISALIPRSSLALLLLLAFWVLFTVFIPNISGVLSEEFSDVPSEYQMAKRVGEMTEKEVWARIDVVRERVNNGELKTEEEVKKETDRAFDMGQEDLIKHYKAYDDAMQKRARTAQNLSRISPTAMFQYASENVAQTGPHNEELFLKDIRNYANVYDDYILKKVGKLVGTSSWSFSTTFQIDGKPVHISSPQPEIYDGDKSDFPQFTETPSSLGDDLIIAFPDLAGLILWNIVLAVLAFVAFLRADVR
ncbi:MAG: ABC transporter permease [Candidatus Aminicenantes bacterium]|nr:ABC transporter permease [Candidatus Aminicenantes bacterium]